MGGWGTSGAVHLRQTTLVCRYSDNALLRWSSVCFGVDFDLCWVKYWIDGRKVADEALVLSSSSPHLASVSGGQLAVSV